jgi:hypothetical protein
MASKFTPMRGSSVPTMVTRYAAAKGRMAEAAPVKAKEKPAAAKKPAPPADRGTRGR